MASNANKRGKQLKLTSMLSTRNVSFL